MERLNDYARQAGLSSTPALLALNRHYSPGTPRAAKDVEAVWLVRGAVRELGGACAASTARAARTGRRWKSRYRSRRSGGWAVSGPGKSMACCAARGPLSNVCEPPTSYPLPHLPAPHLLPTPHRKLRGSCSCRPLSKRCCWRRCREGCLMCPPPRTTGGRAPTPSQSLSW